MDRERRRAGSRDEDARADVLDISPNGDFKSPSCHEMLLVRACHGPVSGFETPVEMWPGIQGVRCMSAAAASCTQAS